MSIYKIRNERDVSVLGNDPSSDIAIFLGLYNAGKYFAKIESWLLGLRLLDAKLIIVDNASTDDTWQWLNEHIKPLLDASSLTVVRNPINVGGYGSLALNLDLVKNNTWVMTLHQDDYYDQDHIVRHFEATRLASDSVGMISSEATSISLSGKRLSYPRGAWFLGDAPEPCDVFIAHLRAHCYPFSGASFRVKMLEQIQVPWHSTAFPDTEIVLRAAAQWRFLHLHTPTVEYLENPESESHSLTTTQKDMGSFLALVRVFRSEEFADLVENLSTALAENFSLGVNKSLAARFSDKRILGLAQAIAQEAIIQSNGVNNSSASMLAGAYRAIGDSQASSTLDSLASIGDPIINARRLGMDAVISFSGDELRSPENEEPTKKSQIRATISRVLGLFPRRVSKALYLASLLSPGVRKKFPHWDFRWRR
jgi:glycosyltransferase involved in cell wall biosynthesis